MSAGADGTDAVLVTVEGGAGWITMNRPDVHNAFNDALIADLDAAFERLAEDADARAVVVRANGRSFSAGADLNWMRAMADYTEAENRADAMAMASMFRRLYDLPKPTVAMVQGSAFGGGVGLVAACDIAIAAEEVQFSFSEARLGLIPAVISPYVIAAIGARQAVRYFQTAERFSAAEAAAMGLLHQVVAPGDLAGAVDAVLKAVAGNGPAAMAQSKALVRDIAGRLVDDATVAETARRIARLRASDEGREGVAAFLERRAPAWKAAAD